MRHRKKTIKLGRTLAHRDALFASLVCNLVRVNRITTTLQKAKAARSVAEKMVTLGKRGDISSLRRAVSILRQQEAVKILFGTIAPAFKDRAGGYTRIVRLGRRASDGAEMAILEWVNYVPKAPKTKDKKDDKKVASKDDENKAKKTKKAAEGKEASKEKTAKA